MSDYLHLGLHFKAVETLPDLLVELGLLLVDQKSGARRRLRNTAESGVQVCEPFRISRDTGETDKDGNPIFETLPGWYANARIYGPLASGKDVSSLVLAKTLATLGDADNPKLPAGAEFTNGRVYSLDPATVKTPAQGWA